jgi:hypothetical protein
MPGCNQSMVYGNMVFSPFSRRLRRDSSNGSEFLLIQPKRVFGRYLLQVGTRNPLTWDPNWESEPRGLCLLVQTEPKNLQIIQIQPNAKKDCQLRKGQRRGRGETGAETASLLNSPLSLSFKQRLNQQRTDETNTRHTHCC